MSSESQRAIRTLERLRQIVRPGIPVVPRVRELSYEPMGDDGLPLPDAGRVVQLPGSIDVETPFGSASAITTRWPPERLHGAMRVADGAAYHPAVLRRLSGRPIEVPPGAARGPLFFDLETTGLHGGAGTVAFLVGLGWYDGDGTFITEQFVMRGFGNEKAVLHAVAARIAGIPLVVTYNGGSFDLPLMETRWAFHRMRPAFDEIPHLDMLTPARRLWKSSPDVEARSCRLVALEEVVLGQRRVGDVPGAEIPHRYFDFIRSGDPSPLEDVLEHNRLDLLSTAMLFARAQRLLIEGPAMTRDACECLAVARLHERDGDHAQADAAYRAAVAHQMTDRVVQRRAWASYALFLRRGRRHHEAAVAWRQVLLLADRRSREAAEAVEALAIHHEHRVRNLRLAHALATKALARERDESRRDALRRRLARLERKMTADDPAADAAPHVALPWE